MVAAVVDEVGGDVPPFLVGRLGGLRAASLLTYRGRAPSRLSPPNRPTSATRAGSPGSTTRRATSAASTMTAPLRRSRSATVDLPDPIPPVSPTSSTVTDATAREFAQCV